MNLYLLLLILTLVNAGVEPDTKYDGVIINGKYYDKQILKTNLRFANNLVVDYNANVMYLNYYKGLDVNSALIDLNTKEFKDINDVPRGNTQTVDQNTRDVYIGGFNGIYKYDPKNHKSELYAAKHAEKVFFKDVLYFSESPYYFIHTYIDGNKEKIKDLEDMKILDFVIDGENVIFYENYTGVYGQKKGSKDVVKYTKYANALAVDVHGNAYMCDERAIYKFDKKSSSLEKRMYLDDCRCFAFDGNDNVIYATHDSLIRLKNNKDKTFSIFSPFVVLILGLSHFAL